MVKYKINIIDRLLFGLVFFALTSIGNATDVNGRFVVTSADSSRLQVLVQINTNTGSDDLGGATIVIQFDNNSLFFDPGPENNSFIFHNFSNGNYSAATVTKPAVNKLWLNIDLPYNNSNQGTIVSGTNSWTDIATLNFQIINTNDTLKLDWLSSNPYWGVYDANNLTLWNPGILENLRFKVQDITAPELLNVSLIDSSKVKVEFSEAMDSVSTSDISNYTISSGIVVLNSSLSADKKSVVLNTSPHLPANDYTIQISNVKDISNNLISSQSNSFNYSYPDSINNEPDPDDLIPKALSLEQNYPNPFNPTTSIQYSISSAQNVTLIVYDVLGKEVATLVNEEKQAGSYKVNFDAEGLSSGIYIYRLSTERATDTKKMVLLR